MSSSKRDSYTERRDLFRNIWATAMNLDESMDSAKSKNVKTMYMNEAVTPTARRVALERDRKHRLRNLRIVAKKIQEFCDRQDLEDKLIKKGSKRLRKRRRLKSKKNTQTDSPAVSAGTSKNFASSLIQADRTTRGKRQNPSISVVPKQMSSVKSAVPVSTTTKLAAPIKESVALAVNKVVRLSEDSTLISKTSKRNSVLRRKPTPNATMKTTKL